MAIRTYDNGSAYSISIGEAEISAFRRRWPANGLGGLRSLWAQFEKRSGDLIDATANGRGSTERFDGEALKALIDDMQCYADEKFGINSGRCEIAGNSWKEYLGVPSKKRRR